MHLLLAQSLIITHNDPKVDGPMNLNHTHALHSLHESDANSANVSAMYYQYQSHALVASGVPRPSSCLTRTHILYLVGHRHCVSVTSQNWPPITFGRTFDCCQSPISKVFVASEECCSRMTCLYIYCWSITLQHEQKCGLQDGLFPFIIQGRNAENFLRSSTVLGSSIWLLTRATYR